MWIRVKHADDGEKSLLNLDDVKYMNYLPNGNMETVTKDNSSVEYLEASKISKQLEEAGLLLPVNKTVQEKPTDPKFKTFDDV